jgi:DNA-binding transcriptional LysR family regulator
LKRREIDFAVIHSRPIGDDPDLANPIFDTQNLWAAKLYVAVPKDHPLSGLKVIPLSSLKSENILIGNYGCDATIQDYNQALQTCLSKKLNIDRQMVCRESLKDFVSLGLGVTFTGAPHTFKANKNLVLKPIQGAVQRLQYSGAWLPHNNNPALHKFIELAKIQSNFQFCCTV